MNYYNDYGHKRGNASMFFAVLSLLILCIFIFVSCSRTFSEQGKARSWGGEMEVVLEPNQKLEEITWKEDSLWILTRDMREDEVAENYTFYEKDSIGVWEGSIYIKEVSMTDEEYARYLESLSYVNDYHLMSNFDSETGEEVYIHYDAMNGEYSLIKPYTYDEYGGLIPAS